jgi:hypothetical protein
VGKPGDGTGNWTDHHIGTIADENFPDRFALVDINGDERLELVVSEENSGTKPDASVYWFQQPENPTSSSWTRHTVVTQYTTNGMDAADMDGDGDVDIITGEHRGTEKVAIWEKATWGPEWWTWTGMGIWRSSASPGMITNSFTCGAMMPRC